jgi:hypothetical protein
MLDCLVRVAVEEGGTTTYLERSSIGGKSSRIRRRRRKSKNEREAKMGVVEWAASGFGTGVSLKGLYRGFRFRVYTNAIIFVLRMLTIEFEVDDD